MARWWQGASTLRFADRELRPAPQFDPERLHDFVDPLQARRAIVRRLVSLDLLWLQAKLRGQVFLAQTGCDSKRVITARVITLFS